MENWAIGVFASIDAGLGVRLEVARELGVHTIHLHTPHAESRTPERAAEFKKRLADLGIAITVVFAGFEGESYADIPTVQRTVGLMPRETRAARAQELKEIADFARLLEVDVVGVHLGFVPHDKSDADYRELLQITRDICDHCKRNRAGIALGNRPRAGRCVDRIFERRGARQHIRQLRSGKHDSIRRGRADPCDRSTGFPHPQRPLQRCDLVEQTWRNMGR